MIDGRNDNPEKTALDCEAAGELLSSWLDGELALAEARRVGGHIETCPRCVRRIDELLAVSESAQGLFGGAVRSSARGGERRFGGVFDRIGELRRHELDGVLRVLLAHRLLRRLESGPCLPERVEQRWQARARELLFDLISVAEGSERQRLAQVRRDLTRGAYEPLRDAGLTDPGAPPLPDQRDARAVRSALQWARVVLRGVSR